MTSRRKELLGYADPLVVHPGGTVEIKVSSEEAQYNATVVRLLHGDDNPNGPGFKFEEIDSPSNGNYQGHHQDIYLGSYISVPNAPALDAIKSFTIQTWIQPTVPNLGHNQAIAGRWDGSRGYGLFVDKNGRLAFRSSQSDNVNGSLFIEIPLNAGTWYFVVVSYDETNQTASIKQRVAAGWSGPEAAYDASSIVATSDPSGLDFLIAAGCDGRGTIPKPTECFNGKIEGPRLYRRVLSVDEIDALAAGAAPGSIPGLVAAWDFAATEPSSEIIADVSDSGLDGIAVNYPMRGLTGHSWDASSLSRVNAPDQYGAIHFHDDDLVDARWDTDFNIKVPEDLRTGYYAVRLLTNEETDYVPFFVSPLPKQAKAPIAFLAPTNTYLAYANGRFLTSGDFDIELLGDLEIEMDPYDLYLMEHNELGASVYDLHSDGSGIAYSSYLRPIVDMRPTHKNGATKGPRHYPADLYAINFLEEKGFDYDVITDEDIHFHGHELLDQYRVVITGSHPEYWTSSMLDALEEYLADTGRLMYLGGNGFYWVTAFDPERPNIIEIRRGFAGTRTWQSHPGELELASTGEIGGIWRHVGRAPNSLVGIGFAGQGHDSTAIGYRRTAESHNPRAAFIFEGIDDNETIGEFGLILGGAASDEIDRADLALGTPSHALVIATSAGQHSDSYLVCAEDIAVTTHAIGGTTNPNVRADMVYLETGTNGAVFSVGSINWLSALPYSGYDNNVSRITENVLREFLER